MAQDIRRELGPNGLQPRKPVITGPGSGPGGIPISAARQKVHGGAAGRGSAISSNLHGASKDLAAIANRSPAGRSASGKDGDLLSSMAQRL